MPWEGAFFFADMGAQGNSNLLSSDRFAKAKGLRQEPFARGRTGGGPALGGARNFPARWLRIRALASAVHAT